MGSKSKENISVRHKDETGKEKTKAYMTRIPTSFMKLTTTNKKEVSHGEAIREVSEKTIRDKVHVTRQREGDDNNNNTPNKLHSQFAHSNPNSVANLCYLYLKKKTGDNRAREVREG